MTTMLRKIHFIFARLVVGLILIILLAACAAQVETGRQVSPPPVEAATGRLTPFLPTAVVPTATPLPPTTPTLPPTASPTPQMHTVKKGEDMGGIAYQYRITVPELMAANPTVNPRAMSVGTVLVIPPSKTPAPPGQPTPLLTPLPSQAVTTTPIPLAVGAINCYREQAGGIWCFLPVRNEQEITLEGISALIQLRSSGAEPLTQTAYLPLDRLPPRASLPLTAYFPPEQTAALTGPFQAYSEPLTAVASAEDGRYLAAQMDQRKVTLSADGLSADISLSARLADPEASAQRVWVAAVAYDAQGSVVGQRRWENTSGQKLTGSTALPIQFQIYSSGGPIETVDLMIEARP